MSIMIMMIIIVLILITTMIIHDNDNEFFNDDIIHLSMSVCLFFACLRPVALLLSCT